MYRCLRKIYGKTEREFKYPGFHKKKNCEGKKKKNLTERKKKCFQVSFYLLIEGLSYLFSYIFGIPILVAGFSSFETEVGQLLYFVGNTILLLVQLNGIFFTILVVHPLSLHGFKKIWSVVTDRTNSYKNTVGPATVEMSS